MTCGNGNPSRRYAALWLAATMAIATACQDEQAVNLGMPPGGEPELAVGLEASSLRAAIGERVTVAVRAQARDVALHGVQGTVQFDPARLAYVGQATDGDHVYLVMVNDKAADRGSVRFIAIDSKG